MMNSTVMPFWWSWEAMAAISTLLAVIAALFGDRLKALMFTPKIRLVEFPVPVSDQREGLTKPVRFHHYIEVVNDGVPLEDAQIQLLAVTFLPGISNKERFVRVPSVSYPFGSHLGNREEKKTIVYRETVKIGEITVQEKQPIPAVDIGHTYNPLVGFDMYSDPHFQIVGKNYRSSVWPVDFVRDTQIVSYWRLEVLSPENETPFWNRVRNYIREHNEQKRKENLP